MVRSAAHSLAADRAAAASSSPVALLMGCGTVTNGKPSAPRTCAINSAAETNCSVITDTDGVPERSPATLSCKLHDEQLPQSPIPAMSACQRSASSMMGRSAGAL